MNKRPALIAFTILFVVAVGMILFKTTSKAPTTAPSIVLDTGDTLANQVPANILPITLSVETNQGGRKVLLVADNSLTFNGEAPGTMFFEASFPVYFEDEMGAIVAQGTAHANSDWMTTSAVPFTATLQVKPITAPITGSIVFKRDNPSGLPEHDFELRMPAILQNK